jgi:V/A-type H+/Na+-transporting ATPase subunit D
MQTLVATRSELLATRGRATFAAQGRDLLKDKRTALVREFRRHEADLLGRIERLRGLAVHARQQLDDAVAADGPEPLRSGALVAEIGIDATLRSRTVAGVQVIDLDHGRVGRGTGTRGWAPALVSPRLDAVAEAYEEELEWLLDVCAVELSVRRLASEIARTTRQVNALDNVLIPRLQDHARRIVLTLDEREREEHARLRRARMRHAAPPTTTDPDRPDRSRRAA